MRKGLTLVEVLVALAVLALLGPVLAGFITYLQVNTRSEVRGAAVTLAQETLESLRLLNPQSLPSRGCSESTISRAGRNFRVQTCYCANPQLCGQGARHIMVQVFLGNEDQLVYRVETVFTQLR
ncbi:prepilin-type N-terminal cleavage/methylation domain-containing protein [Thermus sediminis]|uniref:prepilin-type N-terminal cleavage/methylation domain-containing protein n=1 Tax=Thermus sediminis TaxID=1761908 RepID=UPI000E3ED719|nr:prepilin-type N-terminal cleavage/methylation domain-containing protein [Thermus sediminis]